MVLRLLFESKFFLLLGFLEYVILNRRIPALHFYVFPLYCTLTWELIQPLVPATALFRDALQRVLGGGKG